MTQTKRTTDGQHEISDFHVVAVTNPSGQKVFRSDSNDGDIRGGIRPLLYRFKELVFVRADLDTGQVCRIDHMSVRQNVEVIGQLDDDARPGFVRLLSGNSESVNMNNRGAN